MARKVTTILALRDNYTAVIKKARRYTSAFDKDVQKMTARLDKSAAKKRELRIKDAPARKALNALEKKIEPMRNVMVKVAANVAHFRHSFKPVEQAADKVLSKAWVVTVKLKDAASAGLRKLTSALKKAASVVLVGGAAAAAAGGYALNSGMTLEGYEVSMQHFVGVNNPNSSEADVRKKTDDYLSWLRTNANATPFGTSEVIQAGSRAVQVAEGNTLAAQGLVRMAEDMAALTPNKTIIDAMEALADAQMGEMERMKEFGFKMSAEAFKAAGYDLFSTKGTSGKTLYEVFNGGAEKLSKTGAGLWSTITGELQSAVQDSGRLMDEALKPFLTWLSQTVKTDIAPTIKKLGASVANALPGITDAIIKAYYWLKERIPAAIDWVKKKIELAQPTLDLLGEFFSSKFTGPEAAGRFQSVWKAVDDTINAIINGLNSAATWVSENWSTIEPAVTTMISWAPGLVIFAWAIKALAAASKLAAPIAGLGKAFSWVNNLGGASGLLGSAGGTIPVLANILYWLNEFNTGFKNSGDGIQAMLGVNMDKSALETVVELWGRFKDYLTQVGENIKTFKSDWDATLKPVLDGINTALQGICDFINTTFTDSWNAVKAIFSDIAGAIQSAITNLSTFLGMNPVNPGVAAEQSAGGNKGYVGDYGTSYLYPKAAGIKRVPWDNYPALLHKGETVLPSGEAGQYRAQGNGGKAANITLNLTVNGANMDEDRLASILVNKLEAVAVNMA